MAALGTAGARSVADTGHREPLATVDWRASSGDGRSVALGTIAWRLWQVDKDQRLRSLFHPFVIWQPNELLVAYCYSADPRYPHNPPKEDCTCGIWGARTLDELISSEAMGLAARLYAPVVLGKVRLYIPLVEEQSGIRAFKAEVLSISAVLCSQCTRPRHPADVYLLPQPVCSGCSRQQVGEEGAAWLVFRLATKYGVIVDTIQGAC